MEKDELLSQMSAEAAADAVDRFTIERMVAESKENAGPDIVNAPFLPVPEWMSHPAGSGHNEEEHEQR